MARHRFEEKDDRVRWGGPALIEDYVRRAHESGAHSVSALTSPHEPPTSLPRTNGSRSHTCSPPRRRPGRELTGQGA
jgi:hypothetical protein